MSACIWEMSTMLELAAQAGIYLLVALVATTAGALTGMGGGVIIKPVLDALGHFDVRSIGMLSSITVLSMATVSIFSGRKAIRQTSAGKIAVPLSLGAVLGGILGDWVMDSVSGAATGAGVTIIQNCLLAVLCVGVMLYMRSRDALPRRMWRSKLAALGTGIALGTFATFLGIGGGPINVALIIFVFGVDIKTAAACSLVTIWFSQATKLLAACLAGSLAAYNLTMLPVMIAGAVLGGFLGRHFQMRLSERALGRAFGGMQFVIIGLCVWNIVQNMLFV